MKRVIVTGAAGFIGANVARRLLDDGVRADLLTAPGSDAWRLAELERRGARSSSVDLADGEARRARSWRSQARMHPATSPPTAATRGRRIDAAILRANVVGTSNLLEAARRAGRRGVRQHRLELRVRPQGSRAGRGRAGRAEQHVRGRQGRGDDALPSGGAERMGCNVCTLRLYSTYGPWEEPEALDSRPRRRGAARQVSTARRPDDRARLRVGGRRRRRLPPRRPGAPRGARRGLQRRHRHRRRRLARRPRSPATSSRSTRRPSWGSMPARAWDTNRWIADSTKIRDRLGWRRRAASERDSEYLQRGSATRPDVLSYYSRASWLDGLANRTNFALARTESWRPPLHSPPTTLVQPRRLAALRRLVDLQAGSIWRDLAGELAAARWPRPRRRLRRPALPAAPRAVGALSGHRHDRRQG